VCQLVYTNVYKQWKAERLPWRVLRRLFREMFQNHIRQAGKRIEQGSENKPVRTGMDLAFHFLARSGTPY
jgi:hypothetical protein